MIWSIEAEPEVEEWLSSLDETSEFPQVAVQIDRLQEEGIHLGEPYTRQLKGRLRELRFRLGTRSARLTYYFRSDRAVVLLTVFFKTRGRETREVERASRAMDKCMREHPHG